MSLLALIKRPGPSGFGYGSTAMEVTAGLDLSGKTYLVTGSNSGLGHETMRVLGVRGAHVIAAARTEAKAKATIAELGLDASMATPVACELSEPDSVRACVEAVKALGRPLDGIIANAGIMALPKLEQQYGYELQFFTNHIGHFILVTGLLDQLREDGRVVILSSSAHQMAPKAGIEFDNLSGERGYSSWTAYGQAKLANLLFARHLATKLPKGQTANALHPGVINTNLGRHMNALMRLPLALVGPLALKTTPQGAATQCYVATHPSLATVSGEYFADSNIAKSTRQGRDMALAAELWDVSEAIVAKL
jgi:NAD(P)-dependent dehydrogenase (short-subunit alcohol dehydrogenase family)